MNIIQRICFHDNGLHRSLAGSDTTKGSLKL